MSNVSVGRHNIGAPIAKSGTKPPKRTGSASGNFVGTGVNRKTGAKAQYSGAQPRSGVDSQAETWLNQAPAPFDNSQASSNPQKYATGPSAQVGGMGGKTGVTGPMTGSAGIGNKNNAGIGAVGIKGSGAGRDNGKVVGKQQSRRVGNVYNQPKAKFYGR